MKLLKKREENLSLSLSFSLSLPNIIKMGEYKYLIYCQISQRLNAISLAHISLELIFEYFEAFSVLFRRSKFGDIEGRAVGHVNDEGVGQHHKLISTRVQFHHVRHFIPSMLQKCGNDVTTEVEHYLEKSRRIPSAF